MKVNKGDFFINDKIIKKEFELINKISIVSQEPYLFDDTIEKNITLKDKLTKKEEKELENIMKICNLNSFVKRRKKKNLKQKLLLTAITYLEDKNRE